jgi:predicted DNA-binding transcriptional regulator AlpA
MAAEQYDKLLTTAEVSQWLGISRQLLEISRSKGNSPIPYIRINRAVRYRLSAINEYLEKQTVCAGI